MRSKSVPHSGTTLRVCEFFNSPAVGWNKRSAVPAIRMVIDTSSAGTARCSFQPTRNSPPLRVCEFFNSPAVGWNKRRAVPAIRMVIDMSSAGTALRSFQPAKTHSLSVSSAHVGLTRRSRVPQKKGSYFRHVPKEATDQRTHRPPLARRWPCASLPEIELATGKGFPE